MMVASERENRDRRRTPKLLDQTEHGVDKGRVDADQPAHFLHRREQRVDLQRTAAFQILQHRGAMRTDARGAIDAVVDVDAERRTKSVAIFFASSHHVSGRGARVGLCRDNIERRVRERGDRVEAEIAPELEPDVVANIGRSVRRTGRLECTGRRVQRVRHAAVRLAEPELVAVSVLDDPGLMISVAG